MKQDTISRYFSECLAGHSCVYGGFEAIHCVEPEVDTVCQMMNLRFPGMPVEDIRGLVERIEREIATRMEEDPSLMLSEILREMKQGVTDKATLVVLALKNKVDERTDGIATEASRLSGGSLFLAGMSRVQFDLNRDPNDCKDSLESSAQGLEARWHLLEQTFRQTDRLDDNGSLRSPYLFFSVHGKSSRSSGDLVIGGRAGRNTTLLDPEIARWIKDKLDIAISNGDIRNGQGEPATVQIAREGEQYSGEYPPAELRYGNDEHWGFGEQLQYVQLEVDRRLRETAQGRLAVAQLLAGVLEDFSSQFSSLESWRAYFEAERTPEDCNRLKGVYRVATVQTSKLGLGKVALSSRWRRALGVKDNIGLRTIGLSVGDGVFVDGQEYQVVQGFKEHVRQRVLAFSDQEVVSDVVEIQSM